ncbi:MAG: hypothetical protein EAZ61_03520 [Oscillatoriales cyanobacterium]|nr:MAG: hypothetical protein EAZ61_03520 [Oscillatoriales cyanobacterium]
MAPELAQQTLPPLSGRTIVEQSLDRFVETNPQIQHELSPASPPTHPEVDLDFQHPNLSNSRRDLASELKALELELDTEDLSSPQSPPSRPSEGLKITPPVTPTPKPELPRFSATPDAAPSPFSSEPIVTQGNPSELPAPQLPQRLPLEELKTIGQAIGQWSQPKTQASVSFAIPRLNSPTFPAQPHSHPTLPHC